MRAAPSPAQTSFGWAKRCSREGDRLLGLAWRPHLPTAGMLRLRKEPAAASGWDPRARMRQEKSPRPAENNRPASPNRTTPLGRHHGATGQRSLNPSAAMGSEPRLFAVSCPKFIYYSYQAPDKNVRQALISLRKHRKNHINDGAGENSLVIKLPEIKSTHRR